MRLCRQSRQRLLFRFRTHPVQISDALAHRVFDAAHHIERAGFHVRSEGLAHVNLAQGFTEVGVRVLHASFPTRLHVFHAPQVFAVEVKILLYKLRRQIRSSGIDDVITQICFPVRDRRAFQLGIDFPEKIRSRDIEDFKTRIPQFFVVDGPVEVRHELGQVCHFHLVFQLIRISAIDSRHGSPGEKRLYAHHRVRVLLCSFRVVSE